MPFRIWALLLIAAKRQRLFIAVPTRNAALLSILVTIVLGVLGVRGYKEEMGISQRRNSWGTGKGVSSKDPCGGGKESSQTLLLRYQCEIPIILPVSL